jgi:hypothetical protein
MISTFHEWVCRFLSNKAMILDEISTLVTISLFSDNNNKLEIFKGRTPNKPYKINIISKVKI